MTAQADIPPPEPPSATSPSSTAESGSGAAPPPQMQNGTFTFTFPLVFVSNIASSSSPSDDVSGNDGTSHTLPPQEIQNLLSRLVRFMPLHFAAEGQFEPIPSGPPQKHATQSALDHLKPVQIDTLPDQDRRCHICMQDYYIKPTGPRSPYVETVKDEDDSVLAPPVLQGILTGGQDDTNGIVEEETKIEGKEEDAETPVEMSCGHVFGEKCLKAWLYQSPTCPLCRVEVESYTEEPQSTRGGGIPAAFAFEGSFPFSQTEPLSEEEMQVDDSSPEDSTDTNTNTQPQFGHLAFQFIFTTPPPPPPSNPAPAPALATPMPTAIPTLTPTISRPTSSHTIRHHPYARTPTPSPLSLPSVVDRPDLFCAQRGSGLCSHDVLDENLLRLECGHAFHEDCLDGSMRVEGYPTEQEGRRCPRCRRWMGVLQ